jgi:chromosome segregation ATPase
MISFPATDIEYALQAEIDSLKEQEKYLRQSLKEAEDKLSQRANTIMTWAKRAIAAEREIERLKVIEAAHHRVVDALWYGEKSPAVGKEWGTEQGPNKHGLDFVSYYSK